MAAIMRGVVTAAFAAVIAGAFQVSAPAAYAAPTARVMCERVNEVGDCEELPPNQQDNGDNCVLVNALGACEDRQEVDDPPHTMDR
ncbi:hypothetical protein MSTE_04930 [Mycobacteroides stephanolepidis]|uniref:Uncharacterized protein n=1 Tax=[Mycobacterium] stephanolepidis TaxID=1520670 RepID=A0A1Z4F4T3_9MYCO|nr:hypothetical protein [[Mycobacterium] stephanolepidis]BAY00222.1 hypothetical protein MSTE_04930 [[Mycobacterium] stephanolepidis]